MSLNSAEGNAALRNCGKAGIFRLAHFLDEAAALFGGDFERAREPAGERAIEERIADQKHHKDGEEGNSHRPQNHFCFEASAEMLAAAFGGKSKDGTEENQDKDQQKCGNKRRNCVERKNVAPGARLNVERAESENGSEQQRKKDTTEN